MSRFLLTRHFGAGSRAAGFAGDRAGATAIEYALIAAFISVSIAVVVPAVGLSVSGLIALVANAF